MNTEIKEGDKVHYTAPHGKKENGVVKSLAEDLEGAFVVYHCNNVWDKYRDYTGVYTDLANLTPGWVEEDEVTVYDVLLARLRAAIHCVNLKDLDGCRYSLVKALEVIAQNKHK